MVNLERAWCVYTV